MLTLGAFGAGLLAGLGIALPLGAIGVLIVREGIERGLRPAATAALAVATVDFSYAIVAVVLGRGVSEALAGWERAIQLVGAAALTVVVVLGLRGLWRSSRSGSPSRPNPQQPLPVAHVFGRFVALTAVNPMTAVYFVALTTGLAGQITGGGAGAEFATGVFLGSLAWQLVLAVGGALAGARMTDRIRVGVSLVGYGIVMLYAVKLAAGA